MFTQKEQEAFFLALEARDKRFDGKFFYGVTTTGIFCRPICAAKPKRKNLAFFASVAEAKQAGFRACRRGRPEAARGSPLWLGKESVVKKAARAIAAGEFQGERDAQFAEKMGMTARHLRRLFQEELGQTPKQFADSQRLEFARDLILNSEMAITAIAFASGYSSLRRFNSAFQEKYKKAPRDFRARRKTGDREGIMFLKLRYHPPYQWDSILDFFRVHSIPGIESVEEEAYLRHFIDPETGGSALARVGHLARENSIYLELEGVHAKSVFAIVRRIKRIFDLDYNPAAIEKIFSRDAEIGGIYRRWAGLRIPQFWDPFEGAIATILGQLVSLKQAQRLVGELVVAYGAKSPAPRRSDLAFQFPTAAALLRSDLSAVKTTRLRRQTIRHMAEAVAGEKILLRPDADFAELRRGLIAIPGIGPWSVEYICMRVLGDVDAFPAKDLVLARVLKAKPRLSPERFRPWRSYLALLLWAEFAGKMSGKGKKDAD